VTSLAVRRTRSWVAAALAGAVVSVALGVYGSAHHPSGGTITTFGFGSLIAMKVWLASAVGVLAVAQLVTAAWMFGRLGLRPVPHLGTVHRVTGAAAVVVSLPVAYHCLWSLGFQSYDTRVLVHSVLGCLVYGALVTKVVALHSGSSRGWLVPLAGGLLFTVLVLTVLTSAVWYFAEIGMPARAPY
jgi:hypothetical protein